MTQSYVGKRAISKGIGRLIPKFVLLACCARVLGTSGRKEASVLARRCTRRRTTELQPCGCSSAAPFAIGSNRLIRHSGKSKRLARVAQSYGEEADGFRLPWAGRG